MLIREVHNTRPLICNIVRKNESIIYYHSLLRGITKVKNNVDGLNKAAHGVDGEQEAVTGLKKCVV